MPIQPWRPLDLDAGDHFLTLERRFRYLLEDLTETRLPQLSTRWLVLVLACPICLAEEELRLAHQIGDAQVQAMCPEGHIWDEPRLDLQHFTAYVRIRSGRTDVDWLWLLEEGFGEEPAPPVDYVTELAGASKDLAKIAKREMKKQVRKHVKTPLRKAKKQAVRQAMRPVAAALRTAWTWQAGGIEPVDSPRSEKSRGKGREKKEKGPTIPPVSAYRKAYGMQAPKKGPKCLVCEDTGRITGPGISIPCTECRGPAAVAAALAAAERKAAKAREPKKEKAGPAPKAKPARPRPAAAPFAQEDVAGTRITRVVQVDQNGQQVDVSSTGAGLSRKDAAAVRAAVRTAAAAAKSARDTAFSTVEIHGENNSVVTADVNGDHGHHTRE